MVPLCPHGKDAGVLDDQGIVHLVSVEVWCSVIVHVAVVWGMMVWGMMVGV